MSNPNTLDKTKPQHQTNWDWRAASNFMFGGAGSGLLLFAALASGSELAYRPFGIIALALIALGLFCVSLEIGRPLRSMNVFRHIQTSWMTREALTAPFLFLSGMLALWNGGASWSWLAALFGLLFLYCQARMLNASKGIPAWREPRVVPLIVVSGLTEGAGLLAIFSSLQGIAPAGWLSALLLLAIVVRAILWRGYRKELSSRAAPPQTLDAFDAIDMPIKIGHWVAGMILVAALATPAVDTKTLLCGIAGFLAVTGGWLFKYTLVARAAYNQGYALARLPVRGKASALSVGEP